MIELKNIYKTYELSKHNKVKALKGINLCINDGELVVLKGSSGSGKSTILSLIAALSKPTSGEVVVDNKNISKLPDDFASLYRRDRIGIVFQKYNLIPSLNVEDNIVLPLVPLNLDAQLLKKKLHYVMEKFSISHKSSIAVKNLSGGEQQRVAIARANVNEPKIIIADEPTANLDEKLSLEFISIVQEMKKMKKTIIIATHDPLFFNLDFVDRVVELKDGEILNASNS